MSRRIASLLIAVSLVVLVVPWFGDTTRAQAAEGVVEMRGFSVAAGVNGEPWAIWSADDGTDSDLYYSRWSGDQWLPARSLFADAATWDSYPSLAVAADGTPWVAWTSADETQGRLYVSRWVGSRWSTPVEVPTGAGSRPQQAALAAAPDGGFWLAWVGFDGNDTEIYAGRWDGLAWSAPERVGADDVDPLAYDTHPRLAVGEDGVAWLVWVSSAGLYDDVVMASHWDGQGWSPEMAVSAPDNTPDVWPSLALDAQGQPWVAWQDAIGQGADTYRRIYVSRWQGARGAWSREELASSPSLTAIDEENPHLSFDAKGAPHLVWAVSGAVSGVAYAAWDGAAWTQPAWAAENVAAQTPVLLPNGVPWLFWEEGASLNQVPMAARRMNQALSPLPQNLALADVTPAAVVIPYRAGAWGDSITLGAYDDPMDSGIPVGPYPDRLDEKMDTRVAPSEVFNKGISGELTVELTKRIGNEVAALQPQFVLVMEGTNDVSHLKTPNHVITNLKLIIDIVKKHVGLDGVHLWFATIIPRIDDLNGDTRVLNEYIRGMAIDKRVPLADQWDAYYAAPNWRLLMRDSKHPNQEGMQLLADTFFTRLLEQHGGLYEETVPPVTWVEPLPAQSLCGDVEVHWNGTDNLSYVTSYDVQWQLNGGLWTDWFVATQAQSGIYESDAFGSTVAFRVRGRDVVGNQSDWSAAVSTQIWDDGPPQDVQVVGLPTAQKPPFLVRWSATDLCSAVTAYDVQWRVGLDGVWQNWLASTASTSATFDPASPEYGKAYYFRVRARDEAGNWSDWSPVAYTYLARYMVDGGVYNVRHQPVLKSMVQMPGSLAVIHQSSRYAAYVADGGNYDLSVSHANYGAWPAMRGITVTADIEGLDLILPPADNVVKDGGFETGIWGQWQVTGTVTPTFSTDARSGDWAALLGGAVPLGVTAGAQSKLSQTLSIPAGLTDPTLSFMVRLDDEADGSGTLRAELEGTTTVVTVTVPAGGWVHVWLPIEEDLGGQSVTVTFSAMDTPPLRLDEVSVGSALKGGFWVYLPAVMRMVVP